MLKALAVFSPKKILSCPSFPGRPLEDFFADEEDYVMYVFSEYIKIVAYAMKY